MRSELRLVAPAGERAGQIAYRNAAASGSATQSDAVQCRGLPIRAWRASGSICRSAAPTSTVGMRILSMTRLRPTTGPKTRPRLAGRRRHRTRFEREQRLQQLDRGAIYDRMVTLALSLPAPATPGFVEQFYRQEAATNAHRQRFGQGRSMNRMKIRRGTRKWSKCEKIVSHLLAAADAIEAIANQSRVHIERAVPKAAIMLIAQR